MSQEVTSSEGLKPQKAEGLKHKLKATYRTALAKVRNHGTRTSMPPQTPTTTERRIDEVRGHLQNLLPHISRERKATDTEARSASPFNRELEDGTSLHDLMTPEGKKHFGKAIKASEGNALVVVHPYYDYRFGRPDLPKDARSENLDAYAENLTREVEENHDKGGVLVLFEEEYKKDYIESILNRMSAKGKGNEVFIVPTQNQEYGKGSSPEPHNGTPLHELANELQTLGLTNASVAGMQFWETTNYVEGQPRYYGCAGYTMERLKEAGIDTAIGQAVLD